MSAKGAAPDRVSCPRHGERPLAFICVHLRSGRGRVYFATPRCPHGDAQAWCNACDEVVRREHGWTDASEAQADFAVYCSECYRAALAQHRFEQYVCGPDEPCDWSEIEPPGA
jgi:hypothetical protein